MYKRQGFDNDGGLTGGIQTTGNYPGRARTPQQLMEDMEEAMKLMPGTAKLNIHASYAIFEPGEFADRDALEPVSYTHLKANDMGVICGVTTNPSLIANEGRDFNEVIKEITTIVDGPISGEVKATTVDAEGMIKEGREIAAIHPNMVVKIPMTVEGLKAVKVLSAEGIKTNVTLIFTANQALLAARAGATYVSPFLGRLDDISTAGIDLIQDLSLIHI